jgi:hypothetical protein
LIESIEGFTAPLTHPAGGVWDRDGQPGPGREYFEVAHFGNPARKF